ncbi:hypothetical protein [Candidatus Pelagibacter sp.]|uniref:hypothetical protein n=1 Tax=Candidatus Pelagibacter sp. TaxID=2024849 RepID=UPI003F840ECF
MNQALINFFIWVGIIGLFIWMFLHNIENKKKEEALEKKAKALKRKNKSKDKKEDKPWIVLPNPAMMLIYAIGIIYFASVFYGLTMFANIIGPFGIIFLFLWLISMNKKKDK